MFTLQTDENGRYGVQADPGCFPFLAAVKDYAEEYLEYRCSNEIVLYDVNCDVLLLSHLLSPQHRLAVV